MTKAIKNLAAFTGRIFYSIVGVAIMFIVFRFACSSNIDVLLGIDSASVDPTAQAAVDQFCNVFSNAMLDLGHQFLNMLIEMLSSIA